jgi:hypothetical protein
MTKLFLALLFAGTLATRAEAQNLEVHEVGTGDLTTNNWQTTWGSYDRDHHQTKNLRITVRDVTRRVPKAQLLVYFVARPLRTGTRFIYSHRSLPVVFGNRIEITEELPAPSIKSNEQNYALSGRRYSSGAVMDGWIVIGRVGSQVFDARASSQTLLDIAKDNGRQPESLQAMIAAAGIHDEPVKPVAQTPTAAAPPLKKELTGAPPEPPPQQQQFATLTKALSITLPYGEATLQPGTKLLVISRNAQSIQVSYGSVSKTIPISMTDLSAQ